MTEPIDTPAAAGQVNAEAARIYDSFFVPALFGQFAQPLCRAAEIAGGDRVLDVGCGTGVAARAAAKASGDPARITGLDCNPGMLAVARASAPGIGWQEGDALDLPFADDSFDAVLCQFALMFFPDRPRALQEMRRVLKPGGHAALAVWAAAETSPGYAAMIALLNRLFGREAAEAMAAPFALGDRDALRSVLDAGGWTNAEIRQIDGTARFPSIAEWMHVDIRGWTLSDMIDESQFTDLSRAAETEFSRFSDAEGRVSFPAPALLVRLDA